MQLIIAEKHSVGENIARVLGVTNKKNGYIEGNNIIVSWCVGHIMALALPNDEQYGEKYQNYWTFDNLPILPEDWKFIIADEKKKDQLDVLKKLMNDNRVDELVCATDAGREGECIFRYIYNFIGCKKPFKRLWISSMEDSAIRQGMANLKPSSDFDNLYAAGFSRAKADWLVGINGSRLFSNRYGDTLNIGRVQTPVLAMIVQRDYDVEHFVKQKYFTVELDCGNFKVSSERIDDENTAKSITAECNGKNAVVKEVKKEIKTINPPKLYDLTTLQREANRQFGYTAKQTLEYTQSLYESKLVTYPRTDSQYLTEDMEQTALNMIDVVINYIPEFGGISIANPDVKRLMNNKKVADHTAIIPTAEIENADLNGLPQTDKNILLLIAGKLLTAAAEPHKYESVKVTVNCENHNFSANGQTIIDDGFKAIESKIKDKLKNADSEKETDTENRLPEISEEQIFENVPANTSEHWTSPPKSYTEDTLLKVMETAGNADYDDSDVEKKGLGTPATRAGIIEYLVDHKYIVRDKKKIFATEKAIKLISVLPDSVKSAKLTVDWETDLQNIEKGKYSANDFMNSIVNFVTELVKSYSERAADSPFMKEKEVIGICPRCGKNIYEGKLSFYCESGKDGCGFTLWKEQKGLKITVDTQSAKKLLIKDGTATLNAVSKDGKSYSADFKIVDTGQYINLEFAQTEKQALGKCPKCGGNVLSGKYGFYCEKKCGAFLGKVFGYELSEKQIKSLLSGKQISYTSNGRKTIVLPELVENNYNGKTSYVWKTQKE